MQASPSRPDHVGAAAAEPAVRPADEDTRVPHPPRRDRIGHRRRARGTTDVSFSPVGREQARRLSGRLAHAGVAAVYASSVGPAMETAAILAEPHGLPVAARATRARSRTVTGRG